MSCTCADPADRTCEECREHESRKWSERRRIRIEASGLPRALRGKAIETLPASEFAIEHARLWADGAIGGLYLHGPNGTLKTYLAAAAAWARLRKGPPLRWVGVADLMVGLRPGAGPEAQRHSSSIVRGTHALVLDDLDKANATEHAREVLFAAIDNRIAAGSSILVTANRDPNAISQRLGKSTASRLRGYCRAVYMGGPDRRVAA